MLRYTIDSDTKYTMDKTNKIVLLEEQILDQNLVYDWK